MRRPASDFYGMEPSRPEDYDLMHCDVIRQRWDQKAERWDTDLADDRCHLHDDDAYRRFLETASAIVTDRAEWCRGRLLVDLACGTGLVLAHFIDRFAQALGLDISQRMLEMARKRQLPRAQFRAGNCFELSGIVSDAGAVLSRGILLSHYGEKWAPVLFRQIHAVLAPGGGFALLDFLNAAARHLYASNPENKTYFHAEPLAALASQAGFRRSTILGEPQRRVLCILLER
jgi:SAM-dependent methyltransferase